MPYRKPSMNSMTWHCLIVPPKVKHPSKFSPHPSLPAPDHHCPSSPPSAPISPLSLLTHISLFPEMPSCRNPPYNNSQLSQEMSFINIEILSGLVSKYSNHPRLSMSFKELNELCHLQLKYSKPEGIIQTAKKINIRQASPPHPSDDPAKKETLNWAFGEFKIFIWVIIYQRLIQQADLKDFSEETIKEIQSIFTSKSVPFIRYEIKLLSMDKSSMGEAWAKDELHIFQTIMKRFSGDEVFNWKFISFALFTESECKYFRNLNHCREKWNNHLNPHVNKGDWTVEEDIRLFELIDEHGLKWSKISKCMDSTRTEHMVKNRYNRYFRLWKTNKHTSISYIRNIFKNKIEKDYFSKRYNQNGQVKTEISAQQSEKDVESNDATIKVFSSQKIIEEKVKQENIEQEYITKNAKKNLESIVPNRQIMRDEKGWNFYPFLNAYLPEFQSNFAAYPFGPTLHH